MLRKTIIIICVLITKVSLAQEVIQKRLPSEYLSDTRDITIYLPDNYKIDSLQNYPLTIILDKALLFDNYVATSKLFVLKDLAPKQIIVGIDMNNTYIEDISFDRNTGELTSSAKNFYQFIRDEVLFYMESNYRVSPFISLVGEAYGANMVSHFLKENSGFINAFICINANFSEFVGQQLMRYNMDKFSKLDNSYYIYLNNSNSFSKRKQVFLTELQENLGNLKVDNLKIISDYITTTNSTSAISESIPRALSKIFEIYAPITKEEYDLKIKDLNPLDAIAYLENKYVEIEFLFGTKLGIRERDIFAIENIVIEKENGGYLKNFGKMILKIFPKSPLGDYYLGKYYESSNMIKKALYHYKVGYGKMDPSDPNADAYYENILRIGGE